MHCRDEEIATGVVYSESRFSRFDGHRGGVFVPPPPRFSILYQD